MKLTEPWRRELRIAAEDPRGVRDRHLSSGYLRASWHAKMSRMVEAGLFTPYVHGGYEITAAGRAALAQPAKEGE